MTPHLSLTSTAARNLSKTLLHISKLTEAPWIQDIRKASQRRFETIKLFRAYRPAVSHIIVLCTFRDKHEGSPDGPRVPCAVDGQQVALDRSDAKITVSGVRLSARIVHAEW
ncbi:MAG: hypothetical protein TE42_09905 [Candidatus Synechococcus spongiarum SP3]|uniref:Uncharacterized protein n=1 Tax=Candidatus Synechococcus spongiarum SP3 TaxID=1604020 RepID=A0A0G2HK46_9SYNE|nr:MAG: hypothetical protein TE42_09905 [Candidatus Synechococcus spongiarum SP3]